jgi:hypothetical protein
MQRLAALALSRAADGVFSVMMEFSPSGTEVRFTSSIADAVSFLVRHPGALILSDGLNPAVGAKGALSPLLEAGHPCAVVRFDTLDPGRIGVEVVNCDDIAVAQTILGDPVLLQKINAAWQYCRELSSESRRSPAKSSGALPM